MSQQPSKINANAEYASGAVKDNVGKSIGSEDYQAQGLANKEKGNNEYNVAESNQTKGPSKTTGKLHAVKGAVKESLGSALNNTSLEQTGAHERRTGNQQVETAKAGNVAGGTTGKVKGTVKENAGYVAGNPQLEAEGKGDRIQGDAKYEINK
ncbi:8757_t:CDS:2 [Funneliformis geosporum]|uniref:14470_t:CDS:1 n=1 Tax=Funneliformis geosporum TaxID=1117311 RepID=A0A9W4SFB9_9GLOM|nr:14470_t:CDS:2 [Funneliformis geosporum]CAI2166606.1 8757_t:CDS:2 [Funneliformis geosporum]